MKTNAESAAARVVWSSLGVLLLTSVHHAYGAWIYATPWRYHAVFISAVTAAAILGTAALHRRLRSGVPGALALGAFILATAVVPVLMFGAFEGFYNHVVKNVLYFGGGSPALLERLFPAPDYVMPNDLLFEITGVAQVIPAALASGYLYRLLRSARIREAAGVSALSAEGVHEMERSRGAEDVMHAP